MRPQWQVKQHGEFWWDIPPNISDAIEATRKDGCHAAVFTYDWEYQRRTNFTDPIANEATTLSRYEIDFTTRMQRNLDSGSRREVRLVYLEEFSVGDVQFCMDGPEPERPQSASSSSSSNPWKDLGITGYHESE